MTIKLNAATGGGSVSLSAPNSTTSNLNVELTLPVDDGAANTFLRSDGSGTLSWAAASSDSITEGNTTVECVDTGSDGHITFDTEGSEAARFDSSQRLLVGTSSARTNFPLGTSTIQHETAVASLNNGLSLVNNGGSAAYNPTLTIGVTRGTSVGQNTALPGANYGFGRIDFVGADGTNLITGARIEAFTDGTPGTNDMPGKLEFKTTPDGASSPTTKFRIGETGRTDFFNASNTTNMLIGSNLTGASNTLITGFAGRTSIDSGGSNVFKVYTDGDVENANNSYTGFSDIKLKENIVDASSQWNDIKEIRVRNYNFKQSTGYSTHTQLGVVAQELETVCPGLVSDKPDLDEQGNQLETVTKSVNYSVLYMKAVKALQEAMERIETLETANASLEARLTALEGGAS